MEDAIAVVVFLFIGVIFTFWLRRWMSKSLNNVNVVSEKVRKVENIGNIMVVEIQKILALSQISTDADFDEEAYWTSGKIVFAAKFKHWAYTLTCTLEYMEDGDDVYFVFKMERAIDGGVFQALIFNESQMESLLRDHIEAKYFIQGLAHVILPVPEPS
jgi:hypothetical protein